MRNQIFVNLPIQDLKKSVEFFTKLGFTFDPRFTDENATCMKIGENIFVMLLVKKFFKTFIPKKSITNSKKSTEVLVALFLDERTEVDKLVDSAIAAGGKAYGKTEDYGWMYGRDFEDIDGHIWEIGYMNEDQMPEEMKKRM